MKLTSGIFAMALTVVSFSCKEDDEAPSIHINSPTSSEVYHWGDTIHASVTFEDNKNLYSFGIYMGEQNGDASTDWAFSTTNSLSGKSYTWEQDLIVPDSLPLNLYLQAYCDDAATHHVTNNVKITFDE